MVKGRFSTSLNRVVANRSHRVIVAIVIHMFHFAFKTSNGHEKWDTMVKEDLHVCAVCRICCLILC